MGMDPDKEVSITELRQTFPEVKDSVLIQMMSPVDYEKQGAVSGYMFVQFATMLDEAMPIDEDPQETMQQLDHMFNAVDSRGEGTLLLDEWMELGDMLFPDLLPDDVKSVFEKLDFDKSGEMDY